MPIYGFIFDLINDITQKYVGEVMSAETFYIIKYDILSKFPYITKDELHVQMGYYGEATVDLSTVWAAFKYFYILSPELDSSHKWKSKFPSDTYTSYICEICGSKKLIHRDMSFGNHNLSCDEVIIKNIIE